MRSSPTDLIDRLERLLAREAPASLAAAWIFGSHAEGRAHRDSDVDVGVLLRRDRLPSAEGRFTEGVRLAAWLIAELRQPLVDLVVLDDAPPGLGAHVATRGRLLFVADAEREHAFRRDAMLRAADLAPFLRRARRLKLEGLSR